MFLFDPTFGSSFENCEKEVHRLMDRAQAEVILCRKWDERRLAYRIKGRKRGVYVLVYFKAPPDKIAPLERDVQLSEDVLRVLVVRADGLTREHMERAYPGRAEDSTKPDGEGRAEKGPDVSEPAEEEPGDPEGTAAEKEKLSVSTETAVAEPVDEGPSEDN
jgi:small subunit ribosomal protein S6